MIVSYHLQKKPKMKSDKKDSIPPSPFYDIASVLVGLNYKHIIMYQIIWIPTYNQKSFQFYYHPRKFSTAM